MPDRAESEEHMEDIEKKCVRQSRAIVAIGESARNYANLYNHYIRLDMWGVACDYHRMIDYLKEAIKFVDDSLELVIYLNADGEQIDRIAVEFDDDSIGLPWHCVVIGNEDISNEYWKDVK